MSPTIRRHLEIRVTSPDDPTAAPSALSVYCPYQDTYLDLDACVSCQHCEGLAIDPSERRSFVICLRGGDHAAPVEIADVRARLATFTRGGPLPSTRVGEIMSRPVVSVREADSLETLLGLLIERHISGVPVVDEAGRAVGIASKTDLLRTLQAVSEGEEVGVPSQVELPSGGTVELGLGFHLDSVSGLTVADIMMPIALTLPEDAEVSRAAALMATDGIHRLVVAGTDGRVVGILTATDVMRWVGELAGHLRPRDAV